MFDINKINIIRSRVSDEDLKKLMDEAQSRGMSLSSLIRRRVLMDNNIDEKTFNKKELKKALKNKTDLHYNLYLVSNTLRVILRMAKSSFIVGRGKDINMLPIVKIINEAFQIYSIFPSEEQKLLQSDMNHLLCCRDRQYLIDILTVNKEVEHRERMIMMSNNEAREILE